MTASLPANARVVARHALGLPNRMRRSCRNCRIVPSVSLEAEIWGGLIKAGFAFVARRMRSQIRFSLTRAGAELALDPGEALDPQAFAKVVG